MKDPQQAPQRWGNKTKVCEILDCSRWTVTVLVNGGQLKEYKIPGIRGSRYDLDEVEALPVLIRQ